MRPSHPTPLHRQYQPSRPVPSSQQQALPAPQPSRRKRLSTLSISSVFTRSAMPSKFNIVRASLYGMCVQCSYYEFAVVINFTAPSRGFNLDHNMPRHRSSLPKSTCHHRSKYVTALFHPMISRCLSDHSARFVPFAIFVCSASLLILLVL